MLRGWNIASLFPRLDKVKDHILFVHAMTGCNTTSAPYGKKKKKFLNQILKSKMLSLCQWRCKIYGRNRVRLARLQSDAL